MKVMFVCRGAEYLGVEYLSSCLKSEGHTTDLVFDPGFDDSFYFRIPLLKRLNRWPNLIQRVKEFRPDVLAISSVSNTYPYICKLVEEIKQAYQCYTIIGGVHATAIPEYVIRQGLFDSVCIGEADEALVELLHYLEERADPRSLKNFCFPQGQEIIKNPLRPLIEDLDSLPFPDKDLFFKYGAFSTTLAVLSGRGCPYSCSFCVNDQWKRMYKKLGRYIRRYSPERLLSELKYFTSHYQIKSINFQDDIFTMNKQWLSQFCELYLRFINLPFQCNVHPMFVTDETAKLLKSSGCTSVCMGMQTAVQNKRMKLLNRIETNEQIQTAVSILKKNHLPIYIDHIFGLPDETLEDIKENFEFNRKSHPNNTATFLLYPFPATSILNSCQESKIINEKNLNRLFKGEGSYHYSSLLELPNKSISETAASLFPLLLKLPRALFIPLIRLFSCKYLQWLRSIVLLLFLPLHNPFQFRERISNYFRMLRRRKQQ